MHFRHFSAPFGVFSFGGGGGRRPRPNFFGGRPPPCPPVPTPLSNHLWPVSLINNMYKYALRGIIMVNRLLADLTMTETICSEYVVILNA